MAQWLSFLCVVFTLPLFFITSSGQGQCGTACSLNLTTCANIDYNIYFTSLQQVAINEANATKYITASKRLPDAACVATFARLTCNIFHPSCDGNSTNPILPCDSICYQFRTDCSFYLNTLAIVVPFFAPYMNCSDPSLYVITTGNTNHATCSALTNTKSTCASPLETYTGACQKFNASLAPNFGKYCSPYVSENIFVIANTPTIQTELDAIYYRAADLFSVTSPLSPIVCVKNILATICGFIYPTCDMVPLPEYNNTMVAVPIKPCYDFCQIAMDHCNDFLVTANVTSSVPGFPATCKFFGFPSSNPYSTVVASVSVNLTCRDTIIPKDPSEAWALPDVVCPTETGRKTQLTDEGSICGMRCPDASYSADEWKVIIVATQIGSSISLVCMLFMIISYILICEKRKFPTILHLNQFIATMLFSISFLIGGRHPDKDVWCVDEGTNATQSNNTACGVQGFFFIFFGLALTAWCLVIAFIIFYALVKIGKNTLQNLQTKIWYIYLFGWGFPLAFAIAALASQSIGYGPPLAWCFIHFNGFGFGSGISKDYALFYIPDGILFVVILGLFLASIGIIARVRSNRSNVSSGFDIFLRTQIRVMVFVIIILAIFFTIFEWRFAIQYTSDTKHLDTVGLSWAYCKMKESLNYSDPGYCPGDHNPARVDYGHTVFESFLLSGVGLLIFIAFGSDITLYQSWWRMIQLMLAGDTELLKDLIIRGKQLSAVSMSKSSDDKKSNGKSGSKSNSNSNSNSRHLEASISEIDTPYSDPIGSSGVNSPKERSRDVVLL